MQVDSLDELKRAFATWRSKKKHAREPVPEPLLARAREATKAHGERAVVRAIRVERSRLFRAKPAPVQGSAMSRKQRAVPSPIPAYSRVELSAPAVSNPRPIAEVETGSGATLRVFEQTPEMLGLLSAMCGVGGAR